MSLERIPYATCYAYSPRGQGAVCACSREVRRRLKSGDQPSLLRYAQRVREQAVRDAAYSEFFGEGVTLVPIPASRRYVPGATLVSERLAIALRDQGLATGIWPGLRRARTVPKSAFAWIGERPSVREHYESFAVRGIEDLGSPVRILMIDDVITKGRTLFAAALRLHEAFPGAQIRAFALARTVGAGRGLERLVDPCRGEIRWTGCDARRSP